MVTITKDQIKSKPVAWLDGSTPDGGVMPGTPIYAVQCGQFLDPLNKSLQSAKRIDLGVDGKLVFLIEDLLTHDEANKIIEITESLGYRPEAPGIVTAPGLRKNKSVHWLAENKIMKVFFNRLSPVLPQEIDGRPLASCLSARINMYRYDKGDVFNPHIDGDWPGFDLSDDGESMIEIPCVRSKLSLVLYLNGISDGVEGGETVIYDKGRVVKIVPPKKGSALVFRHGHTHDTVLHAGAPVLGEIPKYVARINILYDENENFLVSDYS
tara:strand:+ start:23148 stop:23951 length:804 start_codon:yes stop_codon:yes gene_type:complete